MNQDGNHTGAILYELQSIERSKVQKGYTNGYHTTVPQVRDFASILLQTILFIFVAK